MITTQTIYSIICDNCKIDVNEDSDYAGWNDVEFTETIANGDNWVKIDEKHYCPNCYEYNDEDELIIK